MELKDITHRLLHRDDGGGGLNCPDETELAAYADGLGEEKRRQALKGHLAECVSCRQQVAFLACEDSRASSAEVPEWLLVRARELVPERPPSANPLWWATAAAAATCLIVAVALQVRVPTSPVAPAPPAVSAVVQQSSPAPTVTAAAIPPPTVRAAAQPRKTPDLVQPSEGATVGSKHLEFRWRPLPQCLFYELRVTAADGELLFSERTEATHTRLPSSVSLHAGEKYFVWVAAHLREGKTVKARAIGFSVESPKE
jgi:hypothetical protein